MSNLEVSFHDNNVAPVRLKNRNEKAYVMDAQGLNVILVEKPGKLVIPFFEVAISPPVSNPTDLALEILNFIQKVAVHVENMRQFHRPSKISLTVRYSPTVIPCRTQGANTGWSVYTLIGIMVTSGDSSFLDERFNFEDLTNLKELHPQGTLPEGATFVETTKWIRAALRYSLPELYRPDDYWVV